MSFFDESFGDLGASGPDGAVWDGSVTPNTASRTDPLSIFTSLSSGVTSLATTIGNAGAQIRNAGTQRYLADRQVDIIKAQADRAVADAQKPMQAAGKYDSLLMWCAVGGLLLTLYMASKAK